MVVQVSLSFDGKGLHNPCKSDYMNKGDLRNIISTVLDYAALAARRCGHYAKRGRKFGRHIVALAVQKDRQLTDRGLSEFLSKDQVGRMLGYRNGISYTRFSQVRRECAEIINAVYDMMVHDLFKNRQLRLIVQDSTDIFAYSKSDGDARWGHRTPSRREQLMQTKNPKKELFFGYKPHAIVDSETEIPVAVAIMPANRNDKKLFYPLFRYVEENYSIQHLAKYIADSQYDSADIKSYLRERGTIPVIATNGRGHYKSQKPKDSDYGKRWAIEHVFSRLKLGFGLAEQVRWDKEIGGARLFVPDCIPYAVCQMVMR